MTIEYKPDWTFKTSDVASSFDDHVREQLPWYDLATGMVTHVARHFIPDGGLVYDIGASTGNIGNAIDSILTRRSASLMALDNSREMVDLYAGPGTIVQHDIVDYPYREFDFAICFLVLGFLTVKQRRRLLKRLRKRCSPGGAILIVDKCGMPAGYAASVMRDLTIAGKLANGAKAVDIVAKQLSLVGVQRPIEPVELEDGTECFRFGEFAGWLILR